MIQTPKSGEKKEKQKSSSGASWQWVHGFRRLLQILKMEEENKNRSTKIILRVLHMIRPSMNDWEVVGLNPNP